MKQMSIVRSVVAGSACLVCGLAGAEPVDGFMWGPAWYASYNGSKSSVTSCSASGSSWGRPPDHAPMATRSRSIRGISPSCQEFLIKTMEYLWSVMTRVAAPEPPSWRGQVLDERRRSLIQSVTKTDGNHFVFVHGYNVNAAQSRDWARAWGRICFRRLWLCTGGAFKRGFLTWKIAGFERFRCRC